MKMITITSRLMVGMMAMALALAACGDDSVSQDAVDDALADEPAEVPTDEPEAEAELPVADTAADEPAAEEPVEEPVDEGDSDEPAAEEPADLPEPEPEMTMGEIGESFVGNVTMPYPAGPAVEGEVKVYFNNGTNGTIIAIYHGSGLSDPTGLCPGNSLFSGGDWILISNAPASEGACDEGFASEPERVGSVRICTSNVWLYETKIPNDSEGDLYGSLERFVDGGYQGQTAVIPNQAGTPLIDYSMDGYALSPMFTSDGATEIKCDEPLT